MLKLHLQKSSRNCIFVFEKLNKYPGTVKKILIGWTVQKISHLYAADLLGDVGLLAGDQAGQLVDHILAVCKQVGLEKCRVKKYTEKKAKVVIACFFLMSFEA